MSNCRKTINESVSACARLTASSRFISPTGVAVRLAHSFSRFTKLAEIASSLGRCFELSCLAIRSLTGVFSCTSANGLGDVLASILASSLIALLSLELGVGAGLEARRPDWADMGTEKEINKARVVKAFVHWMSGCRFILNSPV